jgi:hypothetical protein
MKDSDKLLKNCVMVAGLVLSLGFYHIDACLLSPGCELIHRCEARLFGTLDASETHKVHTNHVGNYSSSDGRCQVLWILRPFFLCTVCRLVPPFS